MKTIIYYSGHGDRICNPEVVLQNNANVMLTYETFHKDGKPNKRFAAILRKRKQKLRKE